MLKGWPIPHWTWWMININISGAVHKYSICGCIWEWCNTAQSLLIITNNNNPILHRLLDTVTPLTSAYFACRARHMNNDSKKATYPHCKCIILALSDIASRWTHYHILHSYGSLTKIPGLYTWGLGWKKWHYSRFSPGNLVFLVCIIPTMLHTHSLILYQCCIGTDSTDK
jgi:hypothetical protein